MMFEAIELGQTLSKPEFKAAEAKFRVELLELQRQLAEANVATLIIVAGVEGGGKGDVVDSLNKWFDNRGIETHAFWDETDEERERPDYWRYWRRLPPRGSIGIMFGGWYWDPIYQHTAGEIDDAALDDASSRIKALERMLQQDGLLIIKLWFHLSKKCFEKQMKHRREVTRHLPRAGDGKLSSYYRHFLVSAERVIRHTDIAETPWHLIEADDACFRDMSVARILGATLTQRLGEQGFVERRASPRKDIVDETGATILDTLDNSRTLTPDEYKHQLKKYEDQLSKLTWQAYDARRSCVMLFEGWDAAGKGGAIRRLTMPMDARLFRVISVAAPTDEERAHHYLWRFWRQIPRAGYTTFYDRSWYGRVLVERVENLAQPHEWQRAYQEINEFEEQLTEHGIVLLKFWLHITPEEQLRRFEEREEMAWKQYKITADDWRNREKWDAYKRAANEMILRTSTGKAPWTLVAANDKLAARIEVIRTVCERLEAALHE
jgi:polyphosphate:AMP phosphotransferase